MAADVTSTSSNNPPIVYHTVAICADLPKVDQSKVNYGEAFKDRPLSDYWLKQMVVKSCKDWRDLINLEDLEDLKKLEDSEDLEADKDRYKFQHAIANGSRRFDKVHFCESTNIFLFRYIFK